MDLVGVCFLCVYACVTVSAVLGEGERRELFAFLVVCPICGIKEMCE